MKTLIQIGCNTGDQYIFETIYNQKIDNCIFVDANESALNVCKNNFEKFLIDKDEKLNVNINYVCAVISNNSDEYIDFNIPDDEDLSGHSSIYANQLTYRNYKTKKIKNVTIKNLLNFFNLTTVDYLIVDAEGCDKEILSNLDFGNNNIKNVKFEFTHWDGYEKHISDNLNKFIFFLLMCGYTVKKTSATDITASF
jgi:FkbM family methyltransferase